MLPPLENVTFFDIETENKVDPWKHKILTIQVRYRGETTIWKEWEIGERRCIEGFMDSFLREIPRKETSFVGYNVLKFDVWFLDERLRRLGIMNEWKWNALHNIERANQTKDKDIVSFVEHTMKSYRGLLTSDLLGLLRRFGAIHGEAFESFLQSEAEVAQRYQNIVVNRHSIAHGSTVTITLEELIQSYPESKKVIQKVREILRV